MTMLFLFLVPALIAGVVVLQIYLSKQESKWPGLILPLCGLGVFVLIIVSTILYMPASHTTTTSHMIDAGGQLWAVHYDMPSTAAVMDSSFAINLIFQAINLFLLFAVPIGVLLVIYKVVRSKQSKKRDVEKMTIQDL